MSEHEALAPALVAALADLTVVEKGRTAKIKTNKGADYQYDYAAIEDVIKLTRPALAAHGIIALTPIHAHDNGLACTVTLLHTSGERLDLGPFPFPDGRDAQTTGSMVTYHRRYALVAALGMAAGDDDDGAAASAPQARKERQGPAPITPQQMTALSVAFREAGIEDRDEKLAYVADKIGRKVSSSKELTKDEASALIDEVKLLKPEQPELADA